jgi:hypothetical protein
MPSRRTSGRQENQPKQGRGDAHAACYPAGVRRWAAIVADRTMGISDEAVKWHIKNLFLKLAAGT